MSFKRDKGAFLSFSLMQITDMYIHLQGIKLYAYHGVDPQETAVGAYFTIDLKLKTDFSRAAYTDELTGTVSYADIFQSVKDEMRIPSRLLEHVAQRIVQRIFHDFAWVCGLVRMCKTYDGQIAYGRRGKTVCVVRYEIYERQMQGLERKGKY